MLRWSENWDGTESQFGGEEDSLADLLELGDNFAVLVEANNKKGIQFYILACLRKKFLIREAFVYKWDFEFSVGDYAIQGRYYQKWAPLINPMCFWTSLNQLSFHHIW